MDTASQPDPADPLSYLDDSDSTGTTGYAAVISAIEDAVTSADEGDEWRMAISQAEANVEAALSTLGTLGRNAPEGTERPLLSHFDDRELIGLIRSIGEVYSRVPSYDLDEYLSVQQQELMGRCHRVTLNGES